MFIKRRLLLFSVFVVLCSALIFTTTDTAFARSTATRAASSCVTPGATNTLKPVLDGANGLIQVPANLNGTLLLYSHGYTFVGNPLTAADAGDPLTGAALLQQGYALTGASCSPDGWALQQSVLQRIALLHYFKPHCYKASGNIPRADF